MRVKTGIIMVIGLLVFGLNTSVFSQDLDLATLALPPADKMERAYAIQNLDELIEPLLDLFGFYSGGGLYHTAGIHGFAGFDIGLRVVTMMVKDDQKPPIPWPSNDELQGGVFRDITLMPLPLLQASVGLPGNVEATGRFFTYPIGEAPKDGNITLIGLGLKYGLLQNMVLPRVSVVAAYHYLIVPDEFDFGNISCFSGAVLVSKGFMIFDVYGGIGIDYNKLAVDLKLPDPIGEVKKEYTKQNMRYNLGLKIKPIPLVYIHADYNFGHAQGFNVGLGVSFR